MKKIFFRHWIIALSLLTASAILCSLMQDAYAVDQVGLLVLLFMSLSNLIFSLLFATLQRKLQSSLKLTIVLVSLIAFIQVLLNYSYHHLYIDWAAVAEGRDQLTGLQRFVRSQLTYWGIYLLPFIFSMAIYLSRQIKRNSL